MVGAFIPFEKKSINLISEFSALDGGFGYIINKRVIMNFKGQVFHHFQAEAFLNSGNKNTHIVVIPFQWLSRS